MLFLATVVLAVVINLPLPEGSAMLVAHTILRSEDSKQAVQLVTVGFPLTAKDTRLLSTTMNSDPYWHHFRLYPTYLRVGDKVFSGGPRLSSRLGLELFLNKEPRTRYGWTTAFVLPADVKLTGTELKFHHGDGNSKPAVEAFAKLHLTEKDLKAAAIPFRATLKAVGKFHDPLDDGLNVHYIVFVPSHFVRFDDLRIGKAKPRRFPYDLYFGDGKGYRPSRPDEVAATFTNSPPSDAAVRLKFHGIDGWFKAETVIEKPKK